MMHPDTEVRFVSKEVGLGIFATKLIPKGTITWTINALDIFIDKKTYESLHPLYKAALDKYAYSHNQTQEVLNWDHSKYMNHSFFPTLLDTPYNLMIAAKDIEPDEEITCDYGFFQRPRQKYSVFDQGADRKEITKDDILLYHKEWDKQLAEAFPSIAVVKQPLMPIIAPQVQTTIQAILAGERKLDSILTMHFPK